MEAELFRFNNKELRSIAIKAYMQRHGLDKAVCFSCGNASRQLKAAGVKTLDISPTGDLQANRWFTIGEIKTAFPDYFDATSGHLPMDCMLAVADEFYFNLHKAIPNEILLPTGSGETLVCLKMAFPKTKITAVYNLDAATQFEEDAPLNDLVRLLADCIIYNDEPDDYYSD